ncbi:nitroreductase/quinone reductase family protein [Streptomyces sp. T-3]|nr:nitroreductase/quinone reductase family protein [Streptomyces sp. T-3]
MSVQRRLARFNRVFANRIVGRTISRLPGFGAVFHTGRKSGRVYRTPVKVFRNGENYLLSLPYGPQSDWVKNVVTADGCELLNRGRRVRLVEPRLFTDREQLGIPRPIRAALIRLKAFDFIELRPAQVPAAPSSAPRA